MSALGQKQTFAPQKAMSALPPKAGMCRAEKDVVAMASSGSRWRPKRPSAAPGFQLVGAQWPGQHRISFMRRQAAHCQLQVMRVVLHTDPAQFAY